MCDGAKEGAKNVPVTTGGTMITPRRRGGGHPGLDGKAVSWREMKKTGKFFRLNREYGQMKSEFFLSSFSS